MNQWSPSMQTRDGDSYVHGLAYHSDCQRHRFVSSDWDCDSWTQKAWNNSGDSCGCSAVNRGEQEGGHSGRKFVVGIRVYCVSTARPWLAGVVFTAIRRWASQAQVPSSVVMRVCLSIQLCGPLMHTHWSPPGSRRSFRTTRDRR